MISRRSALTGLTSVGAGSAFASKASAQFWRSNAGPAVIQLTTPDAALAQIDALTTRKGKAAPPVNTRILRPFLTVQVVSDERADVSNAMERQRNTGVDIRTTFNVVGLDDAGIQIAIDALYASILQRFTALGYQIVPDSEAFANEKTRKLYRGGQASAWHADLADGGKATFFAPAGDTITMHPGVDFGFGVFRQNLGGGIMELAMDRLTACRELNAGLVGLHLGVRFVDFKTWGQGKYAHLFGDGTGGVKSRAQVAFTPIRSQLYAYPKEPNNDWTTISLPSIATLPSNAITSFEDVTTNGAKAGALLGTAISALAGGSRSYERRDYRISVDQPQFVSGLTTGGDALAAAFLAKLAQAPVTTKGG